MRHRPTNVAQDGTERRASPRPTGPHAVTHPLPPRLVISHTHTYHHKHHAQKNFSWCLYPLPPCIYTLKGISCRDVIFISLSLDHSHFSCYLSHAPRPLYPCLSRIRNTHTYLSRPCQIINYTFTHVTSRTPLI